MAAAAASDSAVGLASLDLHNNALGDDGATAVVDQLLDSPAVSLRQLGLSKNGIGDTGAARLATAIAQRSSQLVTVTLANNVIGEAGALALLKAVRRSGTLTSLDLRGNPHALRGKMATPAAFKAELACNLVFLHAFGAEWPARATSAEGEPLAATLEAVTAALQPAMSHVNEQVLANWRASQYRLGPAKNDKPQLAHCVGKALRLLGSAPAVHEDL